MKCDSTQDGYTSSPLLLVMAVHKLLIYRRTTGVIFKLTVDGVCDLAPVILLCSAEN